MILTGEPKIGTRNHVKIVMRTDVRIGYRRIVAGVRHLNLSGVFKWAMNRVMNVLKYQYWQTGLANGI